MTTHSVSPPQSHSEANQNNGGDPGHEEASATSGTSPPDPEAAFVDHMAEWDKPAIDSTMARVRLRAMNGRSGEQLDADNWADRLISRATSLEKMARDGVPPVEFLPGDLAQGVVYSTGSTGFSAHPGVGKTSLCQRLAIDYLRAGGHVIYLDWESGEGPAVERLMALGADPGLLARMHYLAFPALSLDAWDEVQELWDEWPGALGVWDSMSKALSALGLKENEASDVTEFTSRVNEIGKSRGVANLLIDHVTKADDGKDTYAGRGSGAKLADLEALWYVEKVHGFSDTEVGEVHLHCKKQRRGRLRSTVRLEIGDGQGGLPIRELDRDEATTPAGRIRLDVLAFLKDHPGERFAKSYVRGKVKGENTTIAGALATLAEDPGEPVHVATDDDRRATARYWYEEGRVSQGSGVGV